VPVPELVLAPGLVLALAPGLVPGPHSR